MNEDIQQLTTENEEDIETISGNDLESPENGTNNLPTSPDVSGNAETDSGHKEDSSVVGGTTAPGKDNAEVLKALESVSEKLDDNSDVESLTASVRSLVDVMSVQATALSESPGIPISGYADFDYPIAVEYKIFPTSLGSETSHSESYDTPEDFENGYEYMQNSVRANTLAWFSIRTITDCDDVVVYDSTVTETETPEEIPEETPEETPDTFKEDVLTALESVNENLQSISMNDLDYRQETLQLQQQYLDLQKENRELHYQMLACNIAIGFSILLTLGYMVAHGFFQRMKVG